MNGSSIRGLVPTYREHYWQERRVVIPLRGPLEAAGVGTSIPASLIRESRGRSRHTPGREHETPRGTNRREGERERGQARPRGGPLRF
jgi:hypothetical protein